MSNLTVNLWRIFWCFVLWQISYAAGAANIMRGNGAQYWMYMVATMMLICLVATERQRRG